MIDQLGLMLTNIGHYLNFGFAMMVMGLVLLIVGLVNLWQYLNRRWEVSMTRFNQQFVAGTGNRFTDVRISQARQAAARRMHVADIAGEGRGPAGDIARTPARSEDDLEPTEEL